jgi:hypothetical protein
LEANLRRIIRYLAAILLCTVEDEPLCPDLHARVRYRLRERIRTCNDAHCCDDCTQCPARSSP